VSGAIRSIHVGFGYRTGTSPFRAEITYMTQPRRLLSRFSPSSSSYHVYGRWSNDRFSYATSGVRPYGDAVLVGFELRFLNGVQNLLELAIDLRSARNGNGRVAVRYTGNRPGQPALAKIDYALFQVPVW
jgi:hypothetical protein